MPTAADPISLGLATSLGELSSWGVDNNIFLTTHDTHSDLRGILGVRVQGVDALLDLDTKRERPHSSSILANPEAALPT